MRRQFTLLRLMAAVTVFSLIFGLTGLLWKLDSLIAVGISFVVSLCWLLIVLFAQKKDIQRIARSVIGTILGMCLISFLIDPFSFTHFWEPFFMMIAGAIIGWCTAGILSHRNDEMDNISEWDRQIEADAAAGKFDQLAQKALADHQAGRTKPL